jgi:Uncharacterized conserved protein (DUF2267)/MarC family integral membrane protein
LGAELPILVRGLYYDQWHHPGKPERLRHKKEFLAAVAAELADIGPIDTESATRAVFLVLEHQIAPGEIEDIRGAAGTAPRTLRRAVRLARGPLHPRAVHRHATAPAGREVLLLHQLPPGEPGKSLSERARAKRRLTSKPLVLYAQMRGIIEFATSAIVMLLVTIGPLETAAIFGVLTAGARRSMRARLAIQSVAIAGGVLVVFAIGGTKFLQLLQVSMPAFEVAAGILLLLQSVELIFAHPGWPLGAYRGRGMGGQAQ